MSVRCLICKGFIRRARSVTCKRCGAWNGDSAMPVLGATSSGYWTATGASPVRIAYRPVKR
jgi:hypothetical protein